ncbi:shikimate kinase [Cytophagales bacterium LB-30]|uniref:Shikimate kinase n=1 Tax=Shiella aurantiaca TaxID=3058365 RepID=A0ABT8F2Z2_9BACT|nr:shikimate kinase [Shiella aurantiaca]
MIFFLIGMPGSGKSTLGPPLADWLGYNFVDLDTYIVRKEGQSIAEIFEQQGEDFFRQVEAQALREVAKPSDGKMVIACGGGTPCFHDSMQWMLNQGVVIYLEEEKEELLKRIMLQDSKRPLLRDNPLKKIGDLLQMRSPIYEQATLICKKPTLEKLQQAIDSYLESKAKSK